MLQSSRAAEGSSWTTAVARVGLASAPKHPRRPGASGSPVYSSSREMPRDDGLQVIVHHIAKIVSVGVLTMNLRKSVQERILANISTFRRRPLRRRRSCLRRWEFPPPSLDLHSTSAIRIFCLVAYGIGVIIVRILHTTYHPPKRERFRLCRTRFTRSESLGLAIASRKAGLPPTQSVAHGIIPMMLKCARGAA